MPILLKDDDIRSGTKANACHAPFWPTQGLMVILEYMSIEMLLINMTAVITSYVAKSFESGTTFE